jgi:hypothetical protein
MHTVAAGSEVAGTIIDETGSISVLFLDINYAPIGLGGGYSNHASANGKT